MFNVLFHKIRKRILNVFVTLKNNKVFLKNYDVVKSNGTILKIIRH